MIPIAIVCGDCERYEDIISVIYTKMDVRDGAVISSELDLPPAGIQAPPRVNDAATDYSPLRSASTGSEKEYDPSKSPIFTEIRSFDSHLLAYVIIGIIIFVLCMYVIYTAGDPDHPLQGYFQYTAVSTFLSPLVLFVGGVVSIVALCISSYLVTRDRVGYSSLTFTLFLLVNVFLVFWYLNLMYRIDVVVNGEDHDGNGSGYLVMSIALLLIMMYIAFKKSTLAGTLMLIPIGWYLVVLYKWIFDGYSV